MGLWTQDEAVRGGVCCHASHSRRGKSSGDQLWREQQLGEREGHREQELRAAELSSDPAAPEPAVLLYSSAAAVPPKPTFYTRGRSCRRGSDQREDREPTWSCWPADFELCQWSEDLLL